MSQSIEQAVQALLAMQRESGEWPTLLGTAPDLSDGEAYAESPYVTPFVLHALAQMPATPAVTDALSRGGDFLRHTRAADGAWNYEGPQGQRVPADLDCTAAATAGTLLLGERPSMDFFRLLWQNEQRPGGPYYTWIGVNTLETPLAREVDVLVNANIAWCAGLAGLELPPLARYLTEIVASRDFTGGNGRYFVSPHFAIYTLSRAAACGGMAGLEAVPALLAACAQELLPHAGANALELACAAVTLERGAAPAALIEPYLQALLAQQEADGGWPAWRAWRSFNQRYDGSRALTTALALEALWLWQQR